MVKRLIFVLAILLVSLVSAVDVSVTIKTGPNNDISLNVLNPDTLDAVQTLNINSSDTGIASTTISVGLSKVAFSAVIRKDGKIVKVVKSGDYGNFSTSSAITIDTLAETTTVAASTTSTANTTSTTNISTVNATNVSTTDTALNNSSATSSNTQSGSSGILNNSKNQSSFFAGVSGFIGRINYKSVLKVVIYIVVGIAILIAVFFIIRRIMARRNFAVRQIKTTPPASAIKYSEREISEAEKKIRVAQEEIRKAQADIDVIKNRKSRVTEAERKFQEAKKELEKVRGGL